MNAQELVQYLRLNVSIQDPETLDTDYLKMSDEEILLYMQVVLTRDFPEIPSLDYITNESVYAVILLSKKELFYALAVKEAPLYDIGADNNNYLKRSQRFDHYMKLVAQVDKEYQDFLDDGGAGGNTLTSFDVLLPNRYSTIRNYNEGVIPVPLVFIDNLSPNSVEISWKVSFSRFMNYKIYLSDKPIYDKYNEKEPISSDAKLLTTITDIHHTLCRIEKLSPETSYYIVVCAEEMSTLKGYKQIQVTTPPVVVVGG